MGEVRGLLWLCVNPLYLLKKHVYMWAFYKIFAVETSPVIISFQDSITSEKRRLSDMSHDTARPCHVRMVSSSEETWRRHQMETFSALLALCVGNSSVTGEFPSQRPVTRSFDVFFDLRLNIRFSKQSRRRWFRRHRTHYDITVIICNILSHWPLTGLTRPISVFSAAGYNYASVGHDQCCVRCNSVFTRNC